MGTKPTKNKYEPIFDPADFNLEHWIKFYQNMEYHFPIQDKEIQIKKCYKYFISVKIINNMEQYMREGTYILGMIKEIKKEDWVKDSETEINFYNKIYDEVYGILKSLG